LRIAATELEQQPELASWSPGGYVVALAMSHLSDPTLRTLHLYSWWFHAGTAFAFIAYLAFGKFSHIVFGLANVFFRNLDSSGKLTFPDIEELADTDPDALDHLGVNTIDGISWKGLLDLDACVNCGRCETVCPAHGSGVALSPRKLIQDMQRHLTEAGPPLLAAGANIVGGCCGTTPEHIALLRELLNA